MKRSIPGILMGLSIVATQSALASPGIGDVAPAIHVAQWITQQPPTLPGTKDASKHIFLVEFWATWCPPCLRSIPHLSELHKAHQKDGLIIISVSNEEPQTIQTFIKKKMKMPYYVGSDDDMKTSMAWVNDIQTIPHAFLVDKKGVVVWSGNPLSDAETLDRHIKDVLAGTFDLQTAKNSVTVSRKYNKLMSELQPAYTMRDKKKIFRLLDQMIALKPLELRPYLIKRQFLSEFDRQEEVPAFIATIEKTFEDSPSALRQLAEIELAAEMSKRNPELMLRCAIRANDLTQGRDASILGILAQVQYGIGMVDAAINSQTQAVGLAPDTLQADYKKVLAYYKRVKSLRQKQPTRKTAQSQSPSDD